MLFSLRTSIDEFPFSPLIARSCVCVRVNSVSEEEVSRGSSIFFSTFLTGLNSQERPEGPHYRPKRLQCWSVSETQKYITFPTHN